MSRGSGHAGRCHSPAVPQLPRLRSLPKDRVHPRKQSPSCNSDSEIWERGGRQKLPRQRLGSTRKQGLRSNRSCQELERVATCCTCEEFDRTRVCMFLKKILGLASPLVWGSKEDTLLVPLPDRTFGDPGRLTRTVSDPGRSSGCSLLQVSEGPAQDVPSSLQPSLTAGELPDFAALSEARQESQARQSSGGVECEACLIFFDYGVVVMWGLTKAEEEEVLAKIVKPMEVRPLDQQFVEHEEVLVKYSMDPESAVMRNDIITLHWYLQGDKSTRVAVAHALAQSTKLSVFEDQGLHLVQSTRHLPRQLAETGTVRLSRTALSKLSGRLLLQRSEVDLLRSVLNVPEFFWKAPDSLQELYQRVCEYLEIGERIEAVNGRLEVSQSMLDMVQGRQNVHHGERLEWIVIWLIVLAAIAGILAFCGVIGLIPQWAANHKAPPFFENGSDYDEE